MGKLIEGNNLLVSGDLFVCIDQCATNDELQLELAQMRVNYEIDAHTNGALTIY